MKLQGKFGTLYIGHKTLNKLQTRNRYIELNILKDAIKNPDVIFEDKITDINQRTYIYYKGNFKVVIMSVPYKEPFIITAYLELNSKRYRYDKIIYKK